MRKFLTIILLAVLAVSCGTSGKKASADEQASVVDVPSFSADSAYSYVARQCDFGPRVPGSEAHTLCGDYLVSKLKQFGAEVISQEADVTAWDGTVLRARNIIGVYKPESKKRLLLCAHWDSRPYADNDPDEANHHNPIMGANDGASGVGVLLEVARHIGEQSPELGVDIVFFDVEDYGSPQFYDGPYKEDTWCLGSQYWARHPHIKDYNPRYGILLDMVGGKQARFYYEGYSYRTAASRVRDIWNEAASLGYADRFVASRGGEVLDDHVYVHRIGRIPCVDIINYSPHDERSSFGHTWHTVDDDMQNIDIRSLGIVGDVVMNVIYKEK